jgi:hypothetical protein
VGQAELRNRPRAGSHSEQSCPGADWLVENLLLILSRMLLGRFEQLFVPFLDRFLQQSIVLGALSVVRAAGAALNHQMHLGVLEADLT